MTNIEDLKARLEITPPGEERLALERLLRNAIADQRPPLCGRCGIYDAIGVTVGGAKHLCQQCLDRARYEFAHWAPGQD